MKKALYTAKVIWFALLFGIIFTMSSYAYIDIGSVGFMASAIAAVFITISVVVIAWVRKVKRSVKSKLGIDEDAGKEKEGAVIDYSDDTKNQTK